MALEILSLFNYLQGRIALGLSTVTVGFVALYRVRYVLTPGMDYTHMVTAVHNHAVTWGLGTVYYEYFNPLINALA